MQDLHSEQANFALERCCKSLLKLESTWEGLVNSELPHNPRVDGSLLLQDKRRTGKLTELCFCPSYIALQKTLDKLGLSLLGPFAWRAGWGKRKGGRGGGGMKGGGIWTMETERPLVFCSHANLLSVNSEGPLLKIARSSPACLPYCVSGLYLNG